MANLYEDINEYIGIGACDAQCLRELLLVVDSELTRISELVFDSVVSTFRVRAAISSDDTRLRRQPAALVDWMRSGLAGPHDEAFYERRARIGRVHVSVGLPQRYVFAAMNLIRAEYHCIIRDAVGILRDRKRTMDGAVDRLLDLELAIMLEAYSVDSDAQLARSERIASVRQLAASVGDNLRDPLGVIGSSAYLLRKHPDDAPRIARHLNRMASHIDSCGNIVSNLLTLARDDAADLRPVDMKAVFAEALDAVQIPDTLTVVSTIDLPDLPCCDRTLVREVIINLLRNTVLAFGEKPGQLEFDVGMHENTVTIRLRDTQPDLDPALSSRGLGRVLADQSKDTSLGVTMLENLIDRLGGRMWAVKAASGGSTITIHFSAGREPRQSDMPS